MAKSDNEAIFVVRKWSAVIVAGVAVGFVLARGVSHEASASQGAISQGPTAPMSALPASKPAPKISDAIKAYSCGLLLAGVIAFVWVMTGRTPGAVSPAFCGALLVALGSVLQLSHEILKVWRSDADETKGEAYRFAAGWGLLIAGAIGLIFAA